MIPVASIRVSALSKSARAVWTPATPLAYVVFTFWTFQRTNIELVGQVTTLKLATLLAIVIAVERQGAIRLRNIGLHKQAGLLLVVAVTLLSYAFVSSVIHASGASSSIAGDLVTLLVIVLVIRSDVELRILILAAVAGALFLATSSFIQGIEQGGVTAEGLTAYLSNHIAPTLNIWLGLPLLWVFLRRSDGSVRPIVVVGMVVLATGVVLGLARGVLLSAAIAGSWFFYRASRDRVGRPAVVAASAISGIAVAMAVAVVIQRLLTGGALAVNSLLSGRLLLLDAAWNMFHERPISGFGYGVFRTHWGGYVTHFDVGVTTSSQEVAAHSAYAQIAAELGIVGLLLYVVLLTLLWRVLARQREDFLTRGELHRARSALALQVCTLTVVIDGLLDNTGLLITRSFLLILAWTLVLERLRLAELASARPLALGARRSRGRRAPSLEATSPLLPLGLD